MIHLCTMIGENTLLLNEFITHYKNLGVDRFHFIVHDPSEEQYFTKDVKDILALYHIGVEEVYSGKWNGAICTKLINSVMKKYPEEWFVIADLDECVGINASVSNLCVQNRQRTALMYAAQEGHEEIVRYLIAQGANKNIMDSRGKTAYHYMIGEAPWKNPYHKMTIGDGMTRPREKDDKKTLFTEKQIESLTPLLLPDIPDNEKKE